MSFLKDALAVFKKNELSFLEKRRESGDVYTFLFEKNDELTWHAGQYGLFTVMHKKIKYATKPFSIASSPAEGVVRITTGTGQQPSEFKQALLELEQGMKIRMSDSVGSFYLKGGGPALLIAGGIGITPFRAMVKQLETEGGGTGKQVKLLYLDSRRNYLFQPELDEAVSRGVIDAAYLATRDELYEEIERFANVRQENGDYYIAGSKSMVDSMVDHLGGKGVSKRNVHKDTFTGIQ